MRNGCLWREKRWSLWPHNVEWESYKRRRSATFTLKWVLLVTVPRTVLDDATNLEMGPGNDAGASTDCVRQPGPKEVSTDCVRQARPKAVLRASAAHSSGRSRK